MIHKRILDAAREQPDAAYEDLSALISGASPGLVEQVLDEYGDPPTEPTENRADEPQTMSVDEPKATTKKDSDLQPADSAEYEPAEVEGPGSSSGDSDEPTPELEEGDLSSEQRETLHAVRADPSATQSEIGDALGVSAATVSRRLSKISGFDWEARGKFVEEFFDTAVIGDGQGQLQDDSLEEFEYRLKAIERQLETDEPNPTPNDIELELALKAIHTIMNSDRISEEEELEIIRIFVGG